MNEQIVLDAKNTVLGRLASYAAKQALLGKKIIVAIVMRAREKPRRGRSFLL